MVLKGKLKRLRGGAGSLFVGRTTSFKLSFVRDQRLTWLPEREKVEFEVGFPTNTVCPMPLNFGSAIWECSRQCQKGL